jgi:proteasome lid subunit RPN8/RPN11
VGGGVNIEISRDLIAQIHAHGEQAYPEEGAGFLLGADTPGRQVLDLIPVTNAREAETRSRRYLLGAEDYLKAEMEADRRGLQLVGVFHSHPDHPDQPSEFDREWAQPFFSYVITGVDEGKARSSRSWRLAEDRSKFVEETIQFPS